MVARALPGSMGRGHRAEPPLALVGADGRGSEALDNGAREAGALGGGRRLGGVKTRPPGELSGRERDDRDVAEERSRARRKRLRPFLIAEREKEVLYLALKIATFMTPVLAQIGLAFQSYPRRHRTFFYGHSATGDSTSRAGCLDKPAFPWFRVIRGRMSGPGCARPHLFRTGTSSMLLGPGVPFVAATLIPYFGDSRSEI